MLQTYINSLGVAKLSGHVEQEWESLVCLEWKQTKFLFSVNWFTLILLLDEWVWKGFHPYLLTFQQGGVSQLPYLFPAGDPSKWFPHLLKQWELFWALLTYTMSVAVDVGDQGHGSAVHGHNFAFISEFAIILSTLTHTNGLRKYLLCWQTLTGHNFNNSK